MSAEARPWAITGTYLESCNCDPICPCRTVGGRKGGRSTHGLCMGALSWEVAEGGTDDVSLAGLRTVLALKYDDDEPGSPWDYALFVDDRADPEQRRLLEAIFLGQLGGTPERQFPWVFKPSRSIGTRVAPIEIDHSERRGWFRAGEEVTVRVGEPVADQQPVTCVIPGHHRPGHEVHGESIAVDAEPIAVDADPLDFRFEGVCGYWSTFSYSSDD
jgi:hypothetical protein